VSVVCDSHLVNLIVCVFAVERIGLVV